MLRNIFELYFSGRKREENSGKDKKVENNVELKLNEIDNRLLRLIERLQSRGLSNEQIGIIGSLVLKANFKYNSKSMKTTQTMIIIIASIVALMLSVWRIDSLNRITCMYGRLLLFKIEPYWDWNTWYESSCLIENPYFIRKTLKERDCFSCEDLSVVDRKAKLSSQTIAENYIFNDLPLIIDGQHTKREIEKWPIAHKYFDLKSIRMIYDEEDWKYVCMFQSNIRAIDHIILLNTIIMQSNDAYNHIGWYAHWENCDKKTEKSLRKYYNRLNIVPLMVELTKSNWIVISTNYTGRHYKKIDASPGAQLMLFIQIKGFNYVKLEPKELCALRGCEPLYETLRQNDLLIYSTKLWQLSYLPGDFSEFNFAIIIGGIYE